MHGIQVRCGKVVGFDRRHYIHRVADDDIAHPDLLSAERFIVEVNLQFVKVDAAHQPHQGQVNGLVLRVIQFYGSSHRHGSRSEVPGTDVDVASVIEIAQCQSFKHGGGIFVQIAEDKGPDIGILFVLEGVDSNTARVRGDRVVNPFARVLTALAESVNIQALNAVIKRIIRRIIGLCPSVSRDDTERGGDLLFCGLYVITGLSGNLLVAGCRQQHGQGQQK